MKMKGAFSVIDSDSEVDIQTQLRQALTNSGTRIIDLFRQIDVDGDGTITKKEFRNSLPKLGLSAPKRSSTFSSTRSTPTARARSTTRSSASCSAAATTSRSTRS